MTEVFKQKLIEHENANLPFVIYRKPKTSQIQAVFQKDDQLNYLKDYSESGFVFAPFDQKKKSILIQRDAFLTSQIVIQELKEFDKTKHDFRDEQKEFHCKLVKKGIAQTENGNLEKVVISRSVQVTCQNAAIELFERLIVTYERAFCYLWHHPKVGTWLGATPEILLSVENNQLTTMALAGTLKYDAKKSNEWGQKEYDEQELVTSFIANALDGKVKDLKIFPRETVQAGGLLHLRTMLKGKISQSNLAAIIAALHPTPAVCGMPMNEAKNFILANENYDREFYTGYLGELNFKSETKRASRRKNQENNANKTIKSTTTLFVNLRCMQLKKNSAIVYVGGGITKDSDPEKEWQETVAKTKTMLQVLG